MILTLQSWELADTDIDPIHYQQQWCDIQRVILNLHMASMWMLFCSPRIQVTGNTIHTWFNWGQETQLSKTSLWFSRLEETHPGMYDNWKQAHQPKVNCMQQCLERCSILQKNHKPGNPQVKCLAVWLTCAMKSICWLLCFNYRSIIVKATSYFLCELQIKGTLLLYVTSHGSKEGSNTEVSGKNLTAMDRREKQNFRTENKKDERLMLNKK